MDDGEGETAVQQIVRSDHPRLRGTLAALEARRAAALITYESLKEIVNQWASTTMTLTDRDLRLMEWLARAQVRKIGGCGDGAVEEIKKLNSRSHGNGPIPLRGQLHNCVISYLVFAVKQ